MVDYQHVAELVVTNVFLAGVNYGAIKARIAHLEKTDARQEKEIGRAHERIDQIYNGGS